jgi:hypothetical protein
MFKADKAVPLVAASVFVVLWLWMAMVLLTGCTPDPEAELQARPHSAVPDFPLPGGFSLVEKQSRSRSRGNWRTVDYLYKGGEDKFAVIRFYEKQMPASGWRLMDKRFVQGRATLNYIKDNEICVLSVYESGYQTCVHVDISPRGAVAPARGASNEMKKPSK